MNTVPIQLWHCVITDDDDRYKSFWPLLNESEQDYALAIKNERRQQRYVLVRGQLRDLLSKAVQQAPESLKISKSEHGKPYLEDYPDIVFNLSHAEDRMIVGVGRNCRLGVDMEMCKPRANLPALVDKCFAEAEAAWWHNLPECEKNIAFYRIWTRKEAFVKATGQGISLGLNRCIINTEDLASLLSIPENYGHASSWHIHEIDLGIGVSSVLIADKAISDIELKSV